MNFNADRSIIESRGYIDKFTGITSTLKGDKLVAYYAMKSVLDNDGLETEDVYFLNAKSGKLFKHQKLGNLGGSVELPENSGQFVVVHNHPNSAVFSLKDLITVNAEHMIKTMIAAGHNGAVYFLSVDAGIRLDLSDEANCNFFERYRMRLCRKYGSQGALVKIAEEMRWNFRVK